MLKNKLYKNVEDSPLSIVEEPQLLLFDETEELIKKYKPNQINTTKESNNYNYNSVIAEAHTPPYKIHKYFARRPWNVFEQVVQSCVSILGINPYRQKMN